jgi:hypothetical protein
MDDQEVRDLVHAAAREEDGRKKLSCAQAHQLAKEHGVPLATIGRMCNEEGVRLTHCQLGCFQ